MRSVSEATLNDCLQLLQVYFLALRQPQGSHNAQESWNSIQLQAYHLQSIGAFFQLQDK